MPNPSSPQDFAEALQRLRSATQDGQIPVEQWDRIRQECRLGGRLTEEAEALLAFLALREYQPFDGYQFGYHFATILRGPIIDAIFTPSPLFTQLRKKMKDAKEKLREDLWESL